VAEPEGIAGRCDSELQWTYTSVAIGPKSMLQKLGTVNETEPLVDRLQEPAKNAMTDH